jgi:hypothetical protein
LSPINGVFVNMKKKVLILAPLGVLSILCAGALLRSYNAVSYLSRNRHATIQVNGAPVDGDVLVGKLTAIITRRDAGKAHSYRVFFETDTDSLGNNGFVIDCRTWLAPRVPFLIEAANYPPCNILSDDVYKDRRWPLSRRGKFIEFTTNEQSTVRIGSE